MATEMTCPNCLAVGVVEGEAEEVVPEQIKCGFCLKLFDYQPNVWDHIRKDYDGEVGAYYLRVIRRPHAEVNVTDEGADITLTSGPLTLKTVHTRVLLQAYRRARQGDAVPDDARILINGIREPLTGAEVRAELATREHVPNKQEAKALRRAKAQGKA